MLNPSSSDPSLGALVQKLAPWDPVAGGCRGCTEDLFRGFLTVATQTPRVPDPLKNRSPALTPLWVYDIVPEKELPGANKYVT